ncbi:MAG: dipeptide ABC transporter ATP-binding protein [Bacteriovoracaceae bacterium]|nr:dipeptide ABC transporter ATP-binding protein [Bacteriovoracaceae bacterium]
MSEYLMEVKNLVKHYPINGGVMMREVARVHALNGVSFKVKAGETLGIVGESGCGKSTLGKTLIRLHDHTSGEVTFQGEDFLAKKGKDLMAARREMQMIFQDPYESLNTRHTVENILTEPYDIHGIGTKEERIEWAKAALKKVGLSEQAMERFPHEFSGGQRQRIGIARAIALKPKVVICDEPVSALDVSVQSQVMNLMLDLQKEMGLTYLFIAHDLAVVKHISDRVMVMYLGNIVEFTDANSIYEKPLHPYTQALISAIPIPDPEHQGNRIILEGDIPSPINLPSGCAFHTRCRHAQDKCRMERPPLQDAPGTSGETHLVACHFAGNLPKV